MVPVAALSQPAPVPSLPDLRATLSHHQHLETPDGLTKDIRFKEQFFRKGGDVWLARILPIHSEGESAEASHHLHPADLALAARHVQRLPDGALKLEFIHAESRQIYEAEPRDHADLGFDGSWDGSSQLIPPGLLASLTPAPEPGPQPGTRWYERREPAQVLKVLWSETFRIPLVMESRSLDGRRFTRLEVTLDPLPATWPWQNLSGFRRRDYTDLLD